MKYSLLIGAALAALAVGSLSAQAACVTRWQSHTGASALKSMKVPPLAHLTPGSGSDGSSSIVGLWHVVHYNPDNSVFFESLEQWHSDGTEFEFANVPAVYGNICLGVWKSLNTRTAKLSHIGWNFDSDGNPIGTFTLTGTAKLNARADHWEGPYDVKILDPQGNLVEEDTGTSKADRISVQ